jgi:TonB family protein
MIAVRRSSSLFATILALAVSTSAAASDELARAKDLYKSAAYDEALTALDQIAAQTSGPELAELNDYRLFCLIALDRKNDARVAIESMVNTNPFYQLSADQAAPRVRTMFTDIRQALLPGILQREYAAAKAAFDRQEPEAGPQFDRVLKLLDDPLVKSTPALADLRTVATGFRDLSRAREPKPSPPPPAAPVVAEVQAPVSAPATTPSSTPAGPARAAAARPGPAVYRDGDAEVVPPIPVKQTMPQLVVPQGTRPWQSEAIVEVTIDESGDVVNAVLRKTIHPTYDPQIVKAALTWKYEPARKGGVAVRFVRMVAVRLGGGGGN